MRQTHEYAATVLRIALGVMYLAHGSLKLFVFTPEGTAGFFASLGLPGGLGYLAIAAELIGGAALILGLFTRLVSIALLPILLGATFLVHAENGWSFSNQGGGWEYPAFLIFTSLALSLLGNGAFAVKSPFKSRAV
ncbi:DoxX family protein [Neptuniibacter caesariensis]|uniref:DoxX family protein n=1 Tax=Neptuniibacter caesariensis TaxID=207954 RepID=A0A7U8C4N0_NEPCE|nr:DoxX family protein [Neptuniibacter caesariensis]EAR60676.1 hypothetical protein MED92_13413 [Neptuniibacter caesariensis]